MLSKSVMDKVELLDVTLRDGGAINHYNFPPKIVSHIISEMDQSGIGRIEVGYRNGLREPVPGMGPTGLCPKEYLLFCRKYIRAAKLCVMVYPEKIQEQDLKEMRDCKVDSLRYCFTPKQDLAMTLQALEMAKDYGFEVFFNITSASKYQVDQLLILAKEIAKRGPKAIYLADSAGHLTPDVISQFFSTLIRNVDVDFGLHAHDNLFLAQANALAAILAGACFIDASSSGLRRGVGNLKMEGIISLFRSQGSMRYDVTRFFALADYASSEILGSKDLLPAKAIIHGIFNLPPEDAVHLDAAADMKTYYALAEKYTRST